MIRIRNSSGKTKNLNPSDGDFIEILTDDGKKVCCVIYSQNNRYKVIDASDKESFRYAKLFNVQFANPVIIDAIPNIKQDSEYA